MAISAPTQTCSNRRGPASRRGALGTPKTETAVLPSNGGGCDRLAMKDSGCEKSFRAIGSVRGEGPTRRREGQRAGHRVAPRFARRCPRLRAVRARLRMSGPNHWVPSQQFRRRATVVPSGTTTMTDRASPLREQARRCGSSPSGAS